MNPKLKEWKELKASLIADAKALQAQAEQEERDLTDEEAQQIDAKLDEADQAQAEIEKLEQEDARKARLSAAAQQLQAPQRRAPAASAPLAPAAQDEEETVPALPMRGRSREIGDNQLAARFGAFYLATLGNSRMRDFAINQGWDMAVHTEGSNQAGGYLVPEEFSDMIIDLKERYGVFRANTRLFTMNSDTLNIPIRDSGLTAYFVGENSAGTESTANFSNAKLSLKKLMAITTMSSEFAEDAIVSVGDFVAREIAQATSYKEDLCGFNGDGTSTYGGIVGVTEAMGSAGQVSLTSGTNTDWSKITIGDMGNIVATLPEYAMAGDVAWYCSKAFYGSVMQRLQYAGGGNSVADIAGGAGRTFMGYPVRIAQVLPSSATAADIVCLFGDLSLATAMGEGRSLTLATSNTAYVGSTSMFESDSIAVRGVERVDIVCHSVGDSSNAGPIVGGLTAS